MTIAKVELSTGGQGRSNEWAEKTTKKEMFVAGVC